MEATAAPAPQLYGPQGQALPLGIGRAVRAAALRGGTDVAYRAGSQRGQELAGWNPANTSADGGWLWSRDLAVARVRDLVANDPWAQAAADRRVDLIVGTGWRPSLKPDAEALGITTEQANAIGRQFERAWRMWAEDPLCRCDAAESLNAGALLSVCTMEQEVTGDGIGVLHYEEREGWSFGTQLQLIDSDRLSNPSGQPDRPELKGGVELGPREAPIAYHFRNAHPGEPGLAYSGGAFTWTRVPRREPWGRPRVLHQYRKTRPGQTRGVPKLAASLARFKSLNRLAEGEINNAVLNSLFAATITSSFDPAVVQEVVTESAIKGYHGLRNDYYDTTDPRLNGARIQQLFPGDELKFNSSPRATVAFREFTNVFLGSFAASVGLMRQHLTMDWSDTNYSSARAALVEVWRSIVVARGTVAMTHAWPLLLAVLEDAIDHDLVQMPVGAPDLYEMPAAWLRGAWIGPPRGWVDPVKEPTGALMRIGAGLSDWETEAAEQGTDFEVLLERLDEQKRMWAAKGLQPPQLSDMLTVNKSQENKDG